MTKTRAESESLESTLKRLTPLWAEAGKQGASCRMLRLSVLRELTRAIHTLRSECMATDHSDTAGDLARRENFFQSFFTSLPLENAELSEIFKQSAGSTPASRKSTSARVELPSKLLSAVGEAKLSRQDRKWEAELAQEAMRQAWEFWQFEASTEIHDVERFARDFSQGLWPHGIVLFVESDGFLKVSDQDPNQAYWRGRWFVVLNPSFAKLITEKNNQQPQAVDPQWQRLYPVQ